MTAFLLAAWLGFNCWVYELARQRRDIILRAISLAAIILTTIHLFLYLQPDPPPIDVIVRLAPTTTTTPANVRYP